MGPDLQVNDMHVISNNHPVKSIHAEERARIVYSLHKEQQSFKKTFKIRIGIHTGPPTKCSSYSQLIYGYNPASVFSAYSGSKTYNTSSQNFRLIPSHMCLFGLCFPS